MKKVFIGLIALSLIGSCSKDDNTAEKYQNYISLIQGNWEITSETATFYDVDNNVLQEQSIDDGIGFKWVLQDGKITAHAGEDESETISGTYSLNTKADPPTIQINEDISGDDYLKPFNIVSLDDENLVLEQTQEVSSIADGDALPGADHAMLKIELKRY